MKPVQQRRAARVKRNSIGVAFVCTVVAACATTPTVDPEVEAARAQYQAASVDAAAQRFAGEELGQAQALLASADAALEAHEDAATVDHFAYMSNQTSRTAVALGKAKASEERVTEAAAEREQIRLAARTREADAAHAQADQATAAAEMASLEARTATEELVEERQRWAELAATNEALEALNAEKSERGLIVTLGDMLFDTGRAELKSGADRNLDNIAAFLRDNPERHALIEGFTDSIGGDAYNRELSERRAAAVREALLSRGVEGSRIVSRGYGEQFPVGTNDDAGGRQLNRRVEVIVSNDSTPVEPRT